MPRFTRSNVVDARTMATEVETENLPTDPTSHLILTIEGWNATDEATVAEILAFINRIQILEKGKAIFNLEGEMIAAQNLYLFGSGGLNAAPVATDNQHLTYGLIIPFGRKIFDAEECYPGRPTGDLQITWDTTIPATSFDNAVMSISAINLPDANPSRYLKSTMANIAAPGATGVFDVDLSRGNDLLALLLGYASFAGASEFLFGGDDLSLIMNNMQHAIVSAKAPELLVEMMTRVAATVRSDAAQGGLIPNTHLWMDFDPTRDGQYMIDTRQASDLKLRIGYGVNEAITVAQLELVKL